ncbi:hypothetical protein C491_13322 [Natronococcus amylolyticus DSM 10524]|uniref:Uncharacterized protein n=1 Tax=Natronococcus amylolyticus DSM 10524 TaxID=1227497 RepID=L9X4J5_9EURY|nr:hypothetical protein C491_13322 [Natronococcus amylolyticus DSM 10524]
MVHPALLLVATRSEFENERMLENVGSELERTGLARFELAEVELRRSSSFFLLFGVLTNELLIYFALLLLRERKISSLVLFRGELLTCVKRFGRMTRLIFLLRVSLVETGPVGIVQWTVELVSLGCTNYSGSSRSTS